ncbi:M24 family metallopeptidase [Nesterenkonia xinjiangensis]|uniref:Xaa-Pro aminopeptidase n=1 Tax=Nesterenkonia xinjiangensis TaxID=225327 RepID=A0A7Z0K9J5_9MICC|nr:M24 family metallopeptidase [Nesterenkonia xinjiangensis]NYJ77868.1 Xaa-Pro aminopeptidase [Nesterenkonia xinjiangensis]
MTPEQEFHAKHARLTGILEEAGADALVLSTAGSLSWLLAGARVHISLAGPPILRAVVHRDGVAVGVFSNESARIREEELSPLVSLLDDGTVSLHELDWYADVDDVRAWLPQAAGWTLTGESAAALPLRSARASLLEVEVERYRALCRASAEALTDVLGEVTPETTERQLAAALAPRIIEAGADPVVLLVNGESRAVHRHPLPTDAPLGRRAMAVVCARRQGLIANVTRWVGFGDVVAGEEEMDARILSVEAEAFAALSPGARLESVLDTLKESYVRHGFAADEWTKHHQGGAAGYEGRDPRVFPGVPDLIHENQAFAWNPTGWDRQLGLGAKVEDTVVLRAGTDGSRIDVLSVDERWPTVEVAGIARPAVLRR